MEANTRLGNVPVGDRTKAMSGKYANILIAFAAIAVPMLLLPAILIYLIFTYRLSQNKITYPNLQTFSDLAHTNTAVYYVNFNATTLVFIASLLSTIAPLLASSIMLLYSYPIATRIIRKSGIGEAADLPTPFQLSLLVELSKGGLGPLWSWFKYIFGWKGKRSKIVKELSLTGIFLVGIVALSLLTSAVDTWLHVTTKSVPYSQIIPNVQPKQAYGRGLSPRCAEYIHDNGPYACTGGGGFLYNNYDALVTMYNISPDNRINTFNNTGQTHAMIMDPNPSPDTDFTTSTFTISTQCELISKDCNLTEFGEFNCRKINFTGQLGNIRFNIGFFNSSDGKYNILNASEVLIYDSSLLTVQINPFYWALASYTAGVNTDLGDPNIVPTGNRKSVGSILWCNTTVYDTTYSQVNGSITQLVSAPSNNTLGGIFSIPLITAPGLWMPTLKDGMQQAFLSSNTSQQLLNKFMPVFSRIAIAFGAPGMSPRKNIEDQTRISLIVAKVPKAPLYAILVLGFLYATLGIALMITALCITGESVQDTVVKLGIPGLVAEGFERARLGKPVDRVEELFEEWDGNGSSRVGVHKTELGGWAFTISNKIE